LRLGMPVATTAFFWLLWVLATILATHGAVGGRWERSISGGSKRTPPHFDDEPWGAGEIRPGCVAWGDGGACVGWGGRAVRVFL